MVLSRITLVHLPLYSTLVIWMTHELCHAWTAMRTFSLLQQTTGWDFGSIIGTTSNWWKASHHIDKEHAIMDRHQAMEHASQTRIISWEKPSYNLIRAINKSCPKSPQDKTIMAFWLWHAVHTCLEHQSEIINLSGMLKLTSLWIGKYWGSWWRNHYTGNSSKSKSQLSILYPLENGCIVKMCTKLCPLCPNITEEIMDAIPCWDDGCMHTSRINWRWIQWHTPNKAIIL